MAPHYVVHSFHININIGDCAIHLLVDDNFAKNKKPVVYKAVLIDGGDPNRPVFNSIDGTIEDIESRYTPYPNGNFGAPTDPWLRFDAIMVTHFDQDHYGGVQYLITEGFREPVEAAAAAVTAQVDSAMKKCPKKGPARTAWITATAAVSEEPDTDCWIQNRYMKYASSATGFNAVPDETDDLLTTLYLPYFIGPKKAIGTKCTFTCMDGYDDAACWATGSDSCNVLDVSWGKVEVEQITTNLPSDLSDSDEDLLISGKNYNLTLRKVCKVVANPEAYLGAEIFFNVALPAPATLTSVTNPGKLVKAHKLKIAQGPRIYIIAGLQEVIGGKQVTEPREKTAGDPDPFEAPLPEHAIDPSTPLPVRSKLDTRTATGNGPAGNPSNASDRVPLSGKPPPGVEEILDEDETDLDNARNSNPSWRTGKSVPMNAASLCCIVLYRTDDSATAKDGDCFKALHYFGGDALWDVETAIANWAVPSGADPLNIEALKLSHHGALAALPIQMLDSFKPKRIICSSGDGGGRASRYGHPRTEIMAYLAPWLRNEIDDDGDRPTEAIFLTNFPGYFNVRNSKLLNVGKLRAWAYETEDEDGESPFSVWRSNLWALCQTVGGILNDEDNVLEAWMEDDRQIDTSTKANLSDNQDFLADRMVEIYGNFAAGAASTNLNKGVAMDPNHIPRYIELRLTSTDDEMQAIIRRRGDAKNKYPLKPATMANALKAVPMMTPMPMKTLGSGGDTTPPASRKRIRQVDASAVPPARSGPKARRSPRLQAKRPRDRAIGPTGQPANPSAKRRRMDTFDEQMEIQTTQDDGIIDCDEEAGAPLAFISGDSAMHDVTNAPMGVQSLRRSTSVNKDPFASGNSVHRVAKMMAAAMTSTSDGLYRFYATSFQSQAPVAGSKEIILSGAVNTKFDAFVDTLSMGYLTCNDPGPSSNAPLSSMLPKEYRLSADDAWMQQLTATGLGFNNFSIVGLITPAPATQPLAWPTVQIFALVASLTIKQTTINFSSVASCTVCGLPATTSRFADALLDTHTILSLGVTSDSPMLSVSLTDLIPGGSILTTWASLFAINTLGLSLDTSAGSRTAVSFQSGSNGIVWRRLQFVPTDTTWNLGKTLPFLANSSLGITFSHHQFILTSQVSVLRNPLSATTIGDHTLSIATIVQITIPDTTTTLQVTMWWVFDDNEATLVLCFDKDHQDIEGLIKWLVNLLNTSQSPGYTKDDVHPDSLFTNMPNTKAADKSGPAFFIQQISLTIDVSTGVTPTFTNFTMVLEIDLFGAAFQVNVSGPPVTLSAKLWTAIPDSSLYPANSTGAPIPYVPFLEVYQTLHPFGTVSGEIQLSQLIGSDNASSPPMGIQAAITELSLSLQRASGSTIASFSGTILCDGPSGDDNFPHLDIAEFSIFAHYESAAATSQSFYDVRFSSNIYLFDLRSPPPTQKVLPASLEVSAEISNGTWTFKAAARGLRFAALYQILDKDANSSVVDVLSHIEITELDLTYVYPKPPPKPPSPPQPQLPNTLNVSGTLVIGSLELELAYSYTGATTNPATNSSWSIKAFVGVVGDNTHTLASVVSGLDPDLGAFLDEVPFVRDCALPVTPPLDPTSSGGFADAPVQLFCSSDKVYTVMCFRIEILTPAGALSCTCVRFQPASLIAGAKTRPQPKLILRVSLDKLPSLPSIPVVGSIPQPVDDIDYIFVRDPSTATTGPYGVTDAELAAVNDILAKGQFSQIPFRQAQSSMNSGGAASSSSSPNFVLLAGHHFMVRAEGRVIVDHLFGSGNGAAPTPPPAPQHSVQSQKSLQPLSSTQPRPLHAAAPPAPRGTGIAAQETTTTSGAMKKSFGPLTVTNFGIQIKNGFLYLVLDLTIAMGPIQLTVVGFGVGVSLSAFNLNQLAHLSVSDFSIILSGMSVYCNAAPVIIGGVFIHLEDSTYELYEGGLTVSIPPYTLLAVGAYRRAKPNGFKSVFVFARFDGPLLSLEFAEISGVEAGFGYNYDLRMPGVNDVLDYPLLHSQTGTNNPMDILTQFGTWSTAVEGHFWFAIGCKVDSFELISMEAAIMIAFSTDGDFKVGLAGLATASMPPMVTKREEAFLYVELGVIGAVDVGLGSMWVEAQLTPNSFILYPDCHLTGGFALCYWFPPSPYQGDWVFTVGGYHPAFKPPSYYPKVDQVGISWNLSDCLTVQGGAFFAITPNAAMAGGTLKATFSAWFVDAYFEAWAMMLIKFKPLYFIADIGVSIGCHVHLRLGLLDIGFSIDIGGGLHLTGPRFGGTVYVDLKVHKFSIDFGDQDGGPGPLSWPDFANAVRQSGPKAAASGEITDLIIALVAGAATEKTTSTQSTAATTNTTVTPSVWSVRSGSFVFRVESKFPVDSFIVQDGISDAMSATASSNPTPAYARLMENTVQGSLTSKLTVTVKPATAAADTGDKPWQISPMLKNLPLGLWDKYDPGQDPMKSGNNIADQLNAADSSTAAPHCIGYIITAPKPALPPATYTLPEFNAVAAMEEGIFPDGGTPPRKDRRPLINPPVTDDERPRIIHANGTNNAEFYPQARTAGATKPALWKSVHDTWAAANLTDAQLIADTWTDFMGWAEPKNQIAPIAPLTPPAAGTTPPAPVYPAPPFTPLSASVSPSMMLGQFNDYYLGLPQVCQAVA